MSLANRVRALHVHERNGCGPGDCHCDECCDTIDAVRDAQLLAGETERMRDALERGAREGESDSIRAWCYLALREASE